jgi:hypothetical protein
MYQRPVTDIRYCIYSSIAGGIIVQVHLTYNLWDEGFPYNFQSTVYRTNNMVK